MKMSRKTLATDNEINVIFFLTEFDNILTDLIVSWSYCVSYRESSELAS